MQIPEGYLEGEIRDGFYVESMMKKNMGSTDGSAGRSGSCM